MVRKAVAVPHVPWAVQLPSVVKAKLRKTWLADTTLGARLAPHRSFVGGLWEEMGQLQYRLLLDHGLRPSDVLLDVGCGSLRGGRHFIAYLDAGHYIGVDKHGTLVRRGAGAELSREVRNDKQPRFVYSDRFDIPELDPEPTFALAQSLFSHLDRADAELCLQRVRARVADGCRFFVTFLEGVNPTLDPGHSHSRRGFWFTSDEMRQMGESAGWRCQYIGDWGHPRGQRLVEYRTA